MSLPISSPDIALPRFRLQRSLTSYLVFDEHYKLRRAREIFDKYDTNNDDILDQMELARMFEESPHTCNDLPPSIVTKVRSFREDNGDKLSFADFYKLINSHDWVFRDFIVGYCESVTIPRQGRGAYERHMKFFPPRLAMVIFSVIEVIIFVIDQYFWKDEMKKSLSYNPHKREEIWRYATYMLVHVNVLHLGINLIVQLFLGIALEVFHGWWRVTIVYVAGALAGSVGSPIFSPKYSICGASGGVYALMTAHFASIILNWKEMKHPLNSLFFFLAFCATDLIHSIYKNQTEKDDDIGYIVHLFGAVAGLLVGIGVLRNLDELEFEKRLWVIAVTMYVTLMVVGIMNHVINPCGHFNL